MCIRDRSTSVYSVHIANFLSTCETLMPYKPYVFVVNPKTTANYRKSYIGMEKTDPADAFLIADFARVGRTKKLEPWRGSQFIALKRLTRHRMHLSECIAREKTYMVSNLYLKFSELQLLDGDDRPFGNIYGATSSAVLTEFLSPQEIIDLSEEELLAFLAEKSRNRISDISRTVSYTHLDVYKRQEEARQRKLSEQRKMLGDLRTTVEESYLYEGLQCRCV